MQFMGRAARMERPISLWISCERASIFNLEISRALRGAVEYGNIEYSAVIHPPGTFCSFIHRGTASSTLTAQMTRVWPQATSVEPAALGAMWF